MSKIDSFALIENIYFSCNFLGCDYNALTDFICELEKIVLSRQKSTSDVFLNSLLPDGEAIAVLPTGIQRYPYGFLVKDKFRIYFAKKVSDNNPIYVILSAQYMHLMNVYDILNYVIEAIALILSELVKDSNRLVNALCFKVSRVDICNHNTLVDINEYIKIDELYKNVVTKIRPCFPVVAPCGQYGQKTEYFRYGKGSVCVRFYNKVNEVVAQGEKLFFFKKWLDVGLIDDKTFNIYERLPLLKVKSKDYHVNFLYSNLLEHKELIEPLDLVTINSIFNAKTAKSTKYDELEKFRLKYNIELCKEVINVEFQMRSDFLKECKLINEENNEKLDFNDIDVLFNNSDLLYKYLTSSIFRVVDENSNYSRKRDKKTDSIWETLSCSKVLNTSSEFGISSDEYKIVREYNSKFNSYYTVDSILSKLSHLVYMNTSSIDLNKCDDINLLDALEQCYTAYEDIACMNENFLNFQDKLSKQVLSYGVKK